MVQIAGTYKLEKNENFAEYLISIGVTEDVAKKYDVPGTTLEIVVDGNKYTLKTSVGTVQTFTLNEEFEEPLPIGVTLKSSAKVEGNNLYITSTAPDGRTGVRNYEFSDTGVVLTMSNKDVTAKRYYVRT